MGWVRSSNRKAGSFLKHKKDEQSKSLLGFTFLLRGLVGKESPQTQFSVSDWSKRWSNGELGGNMGSGEGGAGGS